MKSKIPRSDRQNLLDWYKKNARPLPWRQTRDPYAIWISEIMLQQTTVKAVTPYFERFMTAFPSVESLAKARLPQVFELWAGLGYYSRAKNLHKAAASFAKDGFPRDWQRLIGFPGLGPYTARAVATFAFGQRCGVLDANVTRLLCRKYALKVDWWKAGPKQTLQRLADALADDPEASEINQALIELGATICTPANPSCLICPWAQSCLARSQQQVAHLPISKPRRKREFWYWRTVVRVKNGKVLLTDKHDLPFLKGHLLPPGKAVQLTKKPKRFDIKGTVTHHDIFVDLQRSNLTSGTCWVPLAKLKSEVPSSLVRKIIGRAVSVAHQSIPRSQ